MGPGLVIEPGLRCTEEMNLRNWVRLSSVLLLGLSSGLSRADTQSGERVRVRLLAPAQDVLIQSENLRFPVAMALPELRGVQWRLLKGTSNVSLEWKSRNGVWKRQILSSLPLRLETQGARLNGKRIPEHLILEQINGVLEIRAEVPFEDYLLGVLNREMPGGWPLEALKAQAVATRSYTLSQMNSRRGLSFDLEASVLDQEFEWIPEDSRHTPVLKRWQEALNATRDEVLFASSGDVFRAFYHADCGGRTTTPDFVWGPAGDYKSVRDPSCEQSSRNRWKFVATKSWIKTQLSGGGRSPASLRPIEFSWIQSLFDQRVTLVEWFDGLSDLKILSGQNFRQMLGFTQLKSLRFSTRDLGEKIEFSGQGFGHGVGLCQWGSRAWAEKGWKHDQILMHYYPLSHLKRGSIRFASATDD